MPKRPKGQKRRAEVSGIPLSFWGDRRKQVKAGLAQEQKNLEDFASGRLRMGQRSGDGPWRDVTEQWLEHHRRIIDTFESVLAALERGRAP
jgi:hypothetical protein